MSRVMRRLTDLLMDSKEGTGQVTFPGEAATATPLTTGYGPMENRVVRSANAELEGGWMVPGVSIDNIEWNEAMQRPLNMRYRQLDPELVMSDFSQPLDDVYMDEEGFDFSDVDFTPQAMMPSDEGVAQQLAPVLEGTVQPGTRLPIRGDMFELPMGYREELTPEQIDALRDYWQYPANAGRRMKPNT